MDLLRYLLFLTALQVLTEVNYEFWKMEHILLCIILHVQHNVLTHIHTLNTAVQI